MDQHDETPATRGRRAGRGDAGAVDDIGRADPAVEGAQAGEPGPGRGTGEMPFPTPSEDVDLGFPATVATPPSWVGALTGAGFGLMIVELLVLFGVIAQGFAVDRLDGDVFHKLGVAFLTNVGTANGLTILAAALLVGLPALVGARTTLTHQTIRAVTLGLGAMLALGVILATPLAVRARLYVLDQGNQAVDALARRVLVTYTIGTLGTAAVALAACLAFARAGERVPRPGADAGDNPYGAWAGGATAAGETVTPDS